MIAECGVRMEWLPGALPSYGDGAGQIELDLVRATGFRNCDRRGQQRVQTEVQDAFFEDSELYTLRLPSRQNVLVDSQLMVRNQDSQKRMCSEESSCLLCRLSWPTIYPTTIFTRSGKFLNLLQPRGRTSVRTAVAAGRVSLLVQRTLRLVAASLAVQIGNCDIFLFSRVVQR
jgi:hypothetical protein